MPRRLIVALVAGTLLLAGCGAPTQPMVTFSAAGTTVNAEPYRYCDIQVTHCQSHDDSLARLEVPPGDPVRISVPHEVRQAPWTVVVQYTTRDGDTLPPRTLATFVPDKRSTFTVPAPHKGRTLRTIEVQEAGAKFAFTPNGELITDPNGNPKLRTRAVWSLRVTQP